MLKTTGYFDNFASQKHPEVRREWIQYMLTNPIKTEQQPNNRISYWGNISEAENRVLRVITLEDGVTVHNAFFDRNFYKRQQRGEETPMKIQYFPETDTLAIELTTKPVATTDVITDGLILDYDSDGKVVAITLDNYSHNVETINLQALGVPLLAA